MESAQYVVPAGHSQEGLAGMFNLTLPEVQSGKRNPTTNDIKKLQSQIKSSEPQILMNNQINDMHKQQNHPKGCQQIKLRGEDFDLNPNGSELNFPGYTTEQVSNDCNDLVTQQYSQMGVHQNNSFQGEYFGLNGGNAQVLDMNFNMPGQQSFVGNGNTELSIEPPQTKDPVEFQNGVGQWQSQYTYGLLSQCQSQKIHHGGGFVQQINQNQPVLQPRVEMVPQHDDNAFPSLGGHMLQQAGGQMFQQPGDQVFQQPGSQMFQQPGGQVFQPSGSQMFQQHGSQMFEQPGSQMFQQSGGQVFQPSGGQMFQQFGGHMFEKPGSQMFQQPGHQMFQGAGYQAFPQLENQMFLQPGCETFQQPGHQMFHQPGRPMFSQPVNTYWPQQFCAPSQLYQQSFLPIVWNPSQQQYLSQFQDQSFPAFESQQRQFLEVPVNSMGRNMQEMTTNGFYTNLNELETQESSVQKEIMQENSNLCRSSKSPSAFSAAVGLPRANIDWSTVRASTNEEAAQRQAFSIILESGRLQAAKRNGLLTPETSPQSSNVAGQKALIGRQGVLQSQGSGISSIASQRALLKFLQGEE